MLVLGREVQIGSGYADLVAIEPSGRLVLIEVKLARNAEARRAIVAQVLTYAAFLKGTQPTDLERNILGRHLHQRNYAGLIAALTANDQEGSFDPEEFTPQLAAGLAEGRFRLVFVLDEAPRELVQLVGFLESISDKLVIDLVTVSSYNVNGTQVLIPQRVDPQQPAKLLSGGPTTLPPASGRLTDGPDHFLATINADPEPLRQPLQRLARWAIKLEEQGLVRLQTYHGPLFLTLLPRLRTDNVGLVTIYHGDSRGPSIQFFRSVFQRRAPNSIDRIEALINGKIGQGNTTYDISEALLEALAEAYREAAIGKIESLPEDKAPVS